MNLKNFVILRQIVPDCQERNNVRNLEMTPDRNSAYGAPCISHQTTV